MSIRKLPALLAGAALLTCLSGSAFAETTLRVGKAMAAAFNFTPLDVGMKEGIFKKHGLDIKEFSFGGSGKLQQAIAAGSVDIGLGSGPEFAAVVKGSPAIAVGELAGPPSLLGVIVGYDSPIKNVKDLKGKKIAVSTAGSLTQWLVRQLSLKEGWGPTGIEAPPLGADPTMIAAMRTHQVDGLVVDVGTGYKLEQEKQGRVLVKFGDIVDHFIIHVIWAHKDIISKNPQAVKDFLAAWYESVNWMQAHRDESIKIIAPVINVSPGIAARVYDELMPAMSRNGRFDKKGIEVLASSFPELGLMDKKPDLSPYYTEKYLPPAK